MWVGTGAGRRLRVEERPDDELMLCCPFQRSTLRHALMRVPIVPLMPLVSVRRWPGRGRGRGFASTIIVTVTVTITITVTFSLAVYLAGSRKRPRRLHAPQQRRPRPIHSGTRDATHLYRLEKAHHPTTLPQPPPHTLCPILPPPTETVSGQSTRMHTCFFNPSASWKSLVEKPMFSKLEHL